MNLGRGCVHLFRRQPDRVEALRAHLRKNPRLIVSGRNLEGIDLRGRALLGIQFRDCELAFANFSGADLSLARFVDCNLYLADFSESVLYTTWFYECNLTKAVFDRAYLLGLRLRSADITKAGFDDVPLIGLERKSRDEPLADSLHVPLLGKLPGRIPQLEQGYTGITMTGYARTVVFLREEGDARYRTRIRAAETAKYLRAVHADNGYDTRADHYYVVERRQRRQALHGSPLALARRTQDYLFGDLVWRYGSSVARPIIALLLLALLAAGITFAAPLGGGSTGLHPASDSSAYSFAGWNSASMVSYLNVLYFFITSPVGGSGAELTGWVKAVFVTYVLTAIWLLALIFESSINRLGRKG
jgi:Pentapeptide repeats (9 copies)